MPPPEPRSRRPAPHQRELGGPPPTPSSSGQRPVAGRQRPRPSSALAPSPTSLMPVPDHDDQPDEHALGEHAPSRREHAPQGQQSFSERAGRRQFHRQAHDAGPDPASASAELVYLSGRVPRALRDELHIRAIREGRPVVELLRDAIRLYLDER